MARLNEAGYSLVLRGSESAEMNLLVGRQARATPVVPEQCCAGEDHRIIHVCCSVGLFEADKICALVRPATFTSFESRFPQVDDLKLEIRRVDPRAGLTSDFSVPKSKLVAAQTS